MRVVAIGGGTGLSTLLRGLKTYVAQPSNPVGIPPAEVSDLAAIVTVTDDGGSSGRLRKDLNILPPGDIRNCLVALSEDEALLSRLFQYRFESGEGLAGHSFGNLFLAALTGISKDFARAVQQSSEILATRGHIFPSTIANVQLVAKMDDGSDVRGETMITASKKRIVELRMDPADARPLPQTLLAIKEADLITLGPGSLFTSLITNLLVHDVVEAITRSKAVRVFVCNLMTQANESLGLTAADHVEAIYSHAGAPIFDYALINTSVISPVLREKYAYQGAAPIVADLDRLEQMRVRCITGDFAEEGDKARHATDRVARELLRLARLGRPGAKPSPAASNGRRSPQEDLD